MNTGPAYVKESWQHCVVDSLGGGFIDSVDLAESAVPEDAEEARYHQDGSEYIPRGSLATGRVGPVRPYPD